MPAQKILVIDDDAHLRESLAEVLDLEGSPALRRPTPEEPALRRPKA